MGLAAPLICALLLLGISTLAQVRQVPGSDYSPFINPESNDATYRTFRAGGLAGIAGGVLFQGQARFLRENGVQELVDSGALALSAGPAASVTLTLGTTRYAYKLHNGMACPLGKFVERGGEIAFTIPPDESPEAFARLNAAGAVRVPRYANPVFAATEFARTAFIPLLEKADFADVVPLPRELESRIADNINRAAGTGPVQGEGVYVNSDAQTTYAVYLVDEQPGRGRVEVSGVPLKYSWVRRRDGSFGVFKVEAFSDRWNGPQSLTVFQRSSEATQYDVVSFYQAAGVFRAMQQANPVTFSAFVRAACGAGGSPVRAKPPAAPRARQPASQAKPVGKSTRSNRGAKS